MEQYLMDTNVISDYFSMSFSKTGMAFMDTAIDTVPNLSVITQIELLCWKIDTIIEQKVKDFIGDSVILPISSDVILHCVALRKNKKIKTPDAIIGATAIAYNYTLLTNNENDFSNIKRLKILNLMKL
ncbi:MAG: type II toxin-antitoxin system VapC family toxin [Ginsengibacter sp.]